MNNIYCLPYFFLLLNQLLYVAQNHLIKLLTLDLYFSQYLHYSGKYMFSDSPCIVPLQEFSIKEISNGHKTLSLFFLLYFQGFWTDFTALTSHAGQAFKFWNILATIGDCFSNTKAGTL